jgi:hypothetical protein
MIKRMMMMADAVMAMAGVAVCLRRFNLICSRWSGGPKLYFNAEGAENAEEF